MMLDSKVVNIFATPVLFTLATDPSSALGIFPRGLPTRCSRHCAIKGAEVPVGTTHLAIVLFDPVGPRLLETSATSLVSPQCDIRRLYIALGALALAAGPFIATNCVEQFS